jgi:hypothetical protein
MANTRVRRFHNPDLGTPGPLSRVCQKLRQGVERAKFQFVCEWREARGKVSPVDDIGDVAIPQATPQCIHAVAVDDDSIAEKLGCAIWVG